MQSARITEESATGASQRVYTGLLNDLEGHRLVPGQRLVESDLSARFGVGRNAVREALQRLSVRGIVDLSRHRSATIRILDMDEVLEVLDVACAMGVLLSRTAAARFDPVRDSQMLSSTLKGLSTAQSNFDPESFSRARRSYYRTLLAIARNRELQRLFPVIGMHIVYVQYQSAELTRLRLRDYQSILRCVQMKEQKAAERECVSHVGRVREGILSLVQRDNRGRNAGER